MDHLLEAARRVGAILSGQAAVLLVDQLELGQALMDLPLESLGPQRSESVWESLAGLWVMSLGFHSAESGRTEATLPQTQQIHQQPERKHRTIRNH